MIERYRLSEMESEVMELDEDGEWVSYEDYNELCKRIEGLEFPCTCSKDHKLPVEYWGIECPWCLLIKAAKEAIDEGEWADNDYRDKLILCIREVDSNYVPW